MSHPFRTAYDIARERFRAFDRKLSYLPAPKPSPVQHGASKRLAAVVPFSPKAISILAPKPDDAMTIRRFVLQQFVDAQKKGNR